MSKRTYMLFFKGYCNLRNASSKLWSNYIAKDLIGITSFVVFLCLLASCSTQVSPWTHYLEDKSSEIPKKNIWMTYDNDGNLWAVESNQQIYYYDKQLDKWSVKLVPAEHGLTGSINTVAFAANNVLWIGSTAGLGKYELNTGHWTIFTSQDGLLNEDVRAILSDSYNNLWVGTGGGGVYRFDYQTKTLEHIIVEAGFSYFTTRALYQDSRGNIWVAGNALYRYEPDLDRWSTFTDGGKRYYSEVEPSPAIYIDLIGSDDDKERGVTFLQDLDPSLTDEALNVESNPTSWMFPPSETIVLIDDSVTAIAEDANNHLWFGTSKGLMQYDLIANTWTSITTVDGLVNDSVRSIAVDNLDNIWIGTVNGVSQYNAETNQWLTFSKDNGFTDSIIVSIIADNQGNLWFATRGAGIYRYAYSYQ